MMKARSLLAIYQEAEDLINIGAYVSGSSKKIDEAVEKNEKLVSFLIQDIEEIYDQNGYWSKLEEIVS
jgi:flagellum-specific ATP synthase